MMSMRFLHCSKYLCIMYSARKCPITAERIRPSLYFRSDTKYFFPEVALRSDKYDDLFLSCTIVSYLQRAVIARQIVLTQ